LRQSPSRSSQRWFPSDLIKFAIVCSLVLALTRGIDAAGDNYKVIFLGELREAGATTAHALNNHGQVVGESGGIDGAGVSAFTRKAGGTIQALEGLHGGDYSQAFGVNDHGLIVGASDSSSTLQAVVWTPNGKTQEIGTLPGDTASQATGVNNRGQVVGYSSGPNGVHPFVWTKKSGMQGLQGLSGSVYGQAFAINDSGEIVGVSGTHAVLWIPGQEVVDLGTLPGDSTSCAVALNNNGQVVGISSRSHRIHGFFWTKSGGMRDVGVLPGGNDDSVAFGINDAGQVVGQAGDGEGFRAFVWTVDQGLQDLNASLPGDANVHLVCAFAINNHGQIAAYGGPADVHVHHFNAPRAYLLTPSNVRAPDSRSDKPSMNNQDHEGHHPGTADIAAGHLSEASQAGGSKAEF
jgi:probable HAF family extracellular repeat protein